MGRINLVRPKKERGDEAYFTPIEAITPLLSLENLPCSLYEPACGDGAIVKPLREQGHVILASDINDYGLEGSFIADYLTNFQNHGMAGVVTNPPFTLALDFAKKALTEVTYVALLLRLNWLETPNRAKFFESSQLSRVWISSRRLPMMHRYGYEGPKSGSNCAFAWYIWDHRCIDNWNQYEGAVIKFFDWRDYMT